MIIILKRMTLLNNSRQKEATPLSLSFDFLFSKDKSLCLIASHMLLIKFHFWPIGNEEVLPTHQFFIGTGMFPAGALTAGVS